jgi:hypothetical protein
MVEEAAISNSETEDESNDMAQDVPPAAEEQHCVFEDITGTTSRLSEPVKRARKLLMVSQSAKK